MRDNKMQTSNIIGWAVVAIALSTVIACTYSSGRQTNGSLSQVNLSATRNDGYRDGEQDRIRYLIARLSSEEAHDREVAQRELLTFARASAANRDGLIQELLKDVGRHDELDGRHVVLTRTFDYWFIVTLIFLELRAEEAIDPMIKCIHCGNGYSGSFGVRPAFDALQNMGSLAVPKLSLALKQQSDEDARSQVAICLGAIGGEEAKRALQQSLRTEASKDVLNSIKLGLRTIENESRARRR
jgi:hypothetical protein